MRKLSFFLLVIIFSSWFGSLDVRPSFLDISMFFGVDGETYFSLDVNLLPFIVSAIFAYLPY